MTELSRRQVGKIVAGTGTLGVALPLLAACGSEGANGVPTAQVPVGGGVILGSQNLVATQPSKGTFELFSATCTHQGCQVGQVAGGKIHCPCHGSEFSIKDGSVVRGPATSPLTRVAFKVQNGEIVPQA